MFDQLRQRVADLISRGTVKGADPAKKLQILKVDLEATETREDIEQFQDYGFASVPLTGAETVVIFVGGRRDHGLAICTEDRRYRLRNLESGEVAIYSDQGDKVVIKRGGIIEITASNRVQINGDLNVTGDIVSDGDVIAGTVHLRSHTHAAGALVTGPTPGSPVTGSTGSAS